MMMEPTQQVRVTKRSILHSKRVSQSRGRGRDSAITWQRTRWNLTHAHRSCFEQLVFPLAHTHLPEPLTHTNQQQQSEHHMTGRTISVIASTLAVCVTVYYLSMTAPVIDMDKSQISTSAPSVDNLIVRLSKSEQQETRTIHLSILNENTRPVTLLTWDTPLDPSALSTGILQIVDASTGEIIPGPGLKLNRLLPPPRDALVTILPGSTVEKELELKAPWLARKGRSVTVLAEGSWRAVWTKSAEDISDEELAAMTGEEVMTGPFGSVSSAQINL